jgi:hypothetical protein
MRKLREDIAESFKINYKKLEGIEKLHSEVKAQVEYF